MELDVSEIDVGQTVDAALEGLRDRIAERGLRLVTDIEPHIKGLHADERRLRQILYNLLSNAVRFSSDRGEVRLTARQRDGMVELTVADSGAGMPASFLPSAFERFVSRPGGPARGGAGLGLSIVKSFVELHGGTVEIASHEGRGTTVVVRLPLSPPEVAEAAE